MSNNIEQLAETLAGLAAAPDPTEWRHHYTPEEADEYAAELDGIEYELDEGFAGWRRSQPFSDLPEAKKGWIKHRLKRRHLILHGRGAWGVVLVQAKTILAYPVAPSARRPDSPAYRPPVSPLSIARRQSVSTALVAEALQEMPVDRRAPHRWVSEWLRRREEGDTSSPAHLPGEPSPPAPSSAEEATEVSDA